MKKWFTLVVCFLAVNFGAYAQYKSVSDIIYTQSTDAYAQERCKLDVYYPTLLRDVPVVVWFHSGGLVRGNKHIDSELKNSGMVVIAANYRLLPDATIDDCLDDAAAAVAWAFHHCTEYGGSPRKIFVAGHSAGAYLLDMIGLDKHWLAKYGVDADSIAALFPFSGQCLTHFNVRQQQYGIGPLQPWIDEYAPFAHMRPDAPPIVIVSGDREKEMYGRYEEQAFFWRMLKLNGHPAVSIYELKGYSHGEMHHPAYGILKNEINAREAAINKRTIYMKVFPNPATNIVTVEPEGRMESIVVFDMMGEAMYVDNDAHGTTATIDVSGFSEGVYVIRVMTDKGVAVSKLSIVNK